jgi:hypothetical protein
MMAAIRPRSFWPEFLWTNKDFIQFTYDAIKDQNHGKDSLIKNQSNYPSIQMMTQKFSLINSERLNSSLKSALELFESSTLTFQALPYFHLRMLSHSLSISSLPFYNFMTPSSRLIPRIDQYVQEILFDDMLLRQDLTVISQLTDKELIKRCLLRGLLASSTTSNSEDIINLEKAKTNVKGGDKEDEDENENEEKRKNDGDDIPEEMILKVGKWKRRDLEESLKEWLTISEKITKTKELNLNSLVSHLIVFGYPHKNLQSRSKKTIEP